MDWLSGSFVVIGLFIARLGLPLAATAMLVYFLHRLDARWHPQT